MYIEEKVNKKMDLLAERNECSFRLQYLTYDIRFTVRFWSSPNNFPKSSDYYMLRMFLQQIEYSRDGPPEEFCNTLST